MKLSFYKVMVDPDAPSPSNPTYREYLHWYVSWCRIFQKHKMQVLSLILIDAMFRSGNEIVPYESPGPSAGIHRIVFVLFRQQVRQTIHPPGWRQNFNTRDFSAFYNLGSPVTAVYFNCQRESGCGGRSYMHSINIAPLNEDHSSNIKFHQMCTSKD
ncbi:Protein FLOWERING LOCUS T [Ananas comosus]|uniref:Protein FLOWERING LOCUS T n=1 Tax=Ananas comosus TaxID=4615 RepID=A0A199VTE8_ANACO|nr:Protein FLOWERING LOCUS T [Ananas comosus]